MSIQRQGMDGSARRIDDLKSPALPFLGRRRVLSPEFLDHLHSRDQGRLDAERLYALIVPDHGLAVRQMEAVARGAANIEHKRRYRLCQHRHTNSCERVGGFAEAGSDVPPVFASVVNGYFS